MMERGERPVVPEPTAGGDAPATGAPVSDRSGRPPLSLFSRGHVASRDALAAPAQAAEPAQGEEHTEGVTPATASSPFPSKSRPGQRVAKRPASRSAGVPPPTRPRPAIGPQAGQPRPARAPRHAPSRPSLPRLKEEYGYNQMTKAIIIHQGTRRVDLLQNNSRRCAYGPRPSRLNIELVLLALPVRLNHPRNLPPLRLDHQREAL